MTKPHIEPIVWQPPKATPRAKQRSGPRAITLTVTDLPGQGPEDVALDHEGRVLVGLVDGRILRLSPDGRHIETVADTGGRPLGIEVDQDESLVVCDARQGVLRVDPSSGRLHSLVDRIGPTPMLFCNNSAIGRDGSIYFTDSSTQFGIDHFKGELMAHSGTGRLFRRSPDGQLDLLLDGLQFANGVALAPDESFVAVAETSSYDIVRLWLSGEREGQRDVLVANLPAFPDNISTGSDGLIWVALPSPRAPLLDLLLPRKPVLRKAAWALPEALQLKEKKTAWVQAFDLNGRLVHDLQTADDRFFMATGVRERDGVVWLGSLTARTIARIDLPPAASAG